MLNTYNVVIVDDYPAFSEKLATMLATVPGVRVVAFAQNAASGIARILELRPNAAIVDIRLPDGTGFDVLNQVKQKAPQVVVLMMTAFTDGEYATLWQKQGADYFFPKSTGLKDMLAAIRKLAGDHRES